MESTRAFWIRFALFGWGYLALSLVPSIESRLSTTKALAYIDCKVPRSIPARVALYDLLVVIGQLNALSLGTGNGVYQDVRTDAGSDPNGGS
jgi:hypothetical protein